MEQPVILCGLGQLGKRVLEHFRAAGIPIVVIDNRASAHDPFLKSVTLVSGDCQSREKLEQAGVARARGVVIVTSNDLVNISTALMVRHLNPNLRVVVRLFNQNLVTRLGKALANVHAFSTSALTAPLIALTALAGDALGTFTLEDGRRQVVELTVSADSPLLNQTIAEAAAKHQAQVLAHLPGRGEDRLLADIDLLTRLASGDRVVVCGKPEDLGPLLEGLEDEVLPHLLWAGWPKRLGRVIWRMLMEVDLSVKICGAILATVILISTLVYHLAIMPNKSWSHALFQTITVIATGSELRERDHPEDWQQVFVSCLRIGGVALIASFTAIFTNFLLRARLGGALEIRRIPDGGHVIVCGLGNVGYRVVEELVQYGERIVAIEPSTDNRFLATARRLGAAVIMADATIPEVLRQANGATARAVVAVTNNELANLEIALLARDMNPKQRVVVRLTDPQLAKPLREEARIRFAVSIPNLAAPAFLAAFFGDRVRSVFVVGGHMLTVVDMVVQPHDPFLDGKPVRVLAIDCHFVPVTLVAADGSVRQQPLRQALGQGDRLTVIVAMKDLEGLLRRQPAASDWAVDVTAFTLPARSVVLELLRGQQGLSAEAAEAKLGQLPFCARANLTQGQAEDFLADLKHEGVTGKLRSLKGIIPKAVEPLSWKEKHQINPS